MTFRKPAWCLIPLVLVGVIASVLASNREPIPTSSLIFDHRLHTVEQSIDCTVCHEKVASSRKAQDRNLPAMEVCGGCHDTDDDKLCGQCHRDPEDPVAVELPAPTVKFSHERHLKDRVDCATCHGPIVEEPVIPVMATCMKCHNGLKAESDCALCHEGKQTLGDMHPAGWRHAHAEQATLDREWCATCHTNQKFCLDCHRGDNLTGEIHSLNYQFTHGLDAQGKESDCARCHDRRTFCNDCHESQNRMPLAHSTLAWRTEHSQAARKDIENCASCHDQADPTCARSGCHRDSDGIRGTDPRFHATDPGRFDTHGPWHNDDSYFCFNCHASNHRMGEGFCGYCHGD